MLKCAVQNHFLAIERLRTNKTKHPTHHGQLGCKVEPRIENRIVILTPETLIRLQNERQKWEMSITRTINESVKN